MRSVVEMVGAGLTVVVIGLASSGAVVSGSAQGDQYAVTGSALFKSYCSSCHGVGGRGDGPVAQHLRRRPANLTLISQRNKGTFPADEVAAIIDGRKAVRPHGSSDMPVWGDAFKKSMIGGDEATVQARIRSIVRHLESIQEGLGR